MLNVRLRSRLRTSDELLTKGNRPVSRKNPIGVSLDSSPTLVLNADYTPLSQVPLSLWSWQDSLRCVFNGKAVVVSEYNILIRSVSCSFRLPSVIALKQFHKKPNYVPMMTRRNVLIRDDFCCQYCNEKFSPSELSLDHLVPRSKGGRLTWDNTVTACYSCNFKKGNTLPEDLPKLGMRLKKLPYPPSAHELQHKGKSFRKANYHPHWNDFIY